MVKNVMIESMRAAGQRIPRQACYYKITPKKVGVIVFIEI